MRYSVCKKTIRRWRGFTLLEVMVSCIIGMFIALVAVGVFRTVTKGKEMLEANIDISDGLRLGCEMIRNDLVNLNRSKGESKLECIIENTDAGPVLVLTLRSVSSIKARSMQPEGDVYEIQYYVLSENEKSVLMRRQCPITGFESDEMTRGGILYAIAENISGFDVQFFDGSEWVGEWSWENKILPQIVKVSLVSMSGGQDGQGDVFMSSFMLTFPRIDRSSEVGEEEENQQAS